MKTRGKRRLQAGYARVTRPHEEFRGITERLPETMGGQAADRSQTGRDRILTLQRDRRKRLRRIDYYASAEAAAIIDRLRAPRCGGDASSILSRIVREWAARQHSIPEFLASLNAKAAEQ